MRGEKEKEKPRVKSVGGFLVGVAFDSFFDFPPLSLFYLTSVEISFVSVSQSNQSVVGRRLARVSLFELFVFSSSRGTIKATSVVWLDPYEGRNRRRHRHTCLKFP